MFYNYKGKKNDRPFQDDNTVTWQNRFLLIFKHLHITAC